jgi:hypothetical protein
MIYLIVNLSIICNLDENQEGERRRMKLFSSQARDPNSFMGLLEITVLISTES